MLDPARFGERAEFEGDHEIIMRVRPDTQEYQELRDKGLTVHAIGHCIQPRGNHEATYEGYLNARSI